MLRADARTDCGLKFRTRSGAYSIDSIHTPLHVLLVYVTTDYKPTKSRCFNGVANYTPINSQLDLCVGYIIGS